MRRIAILIFCMLIALPTAAADSSGLWFRLKEFLFHELNLEQRKMLKQASDPWMAPTEDLHERFWASFSEEKRNEWIDAEKNGAPRWGDALLWDAMREAFLRSAFETRTSGRPVRVPELELLRNRVLALQHGNTEQWMAEFAREDRWLDPSWTPPDRMPWRNTLRLFAALNEAQVARWHKQMLLRSAWDDSPRKWSYPPLGLTLNAAYPWWMVPAILCEKDCQAWSILDRFDERLGTGVWYFGGVRSMSDVREYPDFRVAMNVMTDMGYPYTVIEQTSEEEQWRGHSSAMFKSSVKLHDGSLTYRVVRMVLRTKQPAIWVLGAGSPTSMSDAEKRFNQLEDALEVEDP
jgi:hypothetical protein